MPCYTVQKCSVELNNADHDLLEQALKKLNYAVSRNKQTGAFKFVSRSGNVTGEYNGKQLNIQARNQEKVDTDAIKVKYSEMVARRQADKFRAKGWNVSHNPQTREWTFQRPRVQTLRG